MSEKKLARDIGVNLSLARGRVGEGFEVLIRGITADECKLSVAAVVFSCLLFRACDGHGSLFPAVQVPCNKLVTTVYLL